MGNAAAKHADETTCVDGGYLFPTGTVYSKTDADVRIVRRLILDRKLAPFYVGTDKENDKCNFECPICFLYLPSNVNLTRCCGQSLCTECFLQIKHPQAGGPATCPFCVEPEFGVTYRAPNSTAPPSHVDASGRRRSLPHNSVLVVTVDQVRPSGRRPVISNRNSENARRTTAMARALSSRARPTDARVARSNTSMAVNGRPVPARPLASSYSAGSEQILESRLSTMQVVDVESEVERMMILEAIRLSLQTDENANAESRDSRSNTMGSADTTSSSGSSSSESSTDSSSSESSSSDSSESSSDNSNNHLEFD